MITTVNVSEVEIFLLVLNSWLFANLPSFMIWIMKSEGPGRSLHNIVSQRDAVYRITLGHLSKNYK